MNVAGAIRLARELGPGHTIVTILCDHGARYQSKLFNPAFLGEKKPAGAALARRTRGGIPDVAVDPAVTASIRCAGFACVTSVIVVRRAALP